MPKLEMLMAQPTEAPARPPVVEKEGVKPEEAIKVLPKPAEAVTEAKPHDPVEPPPYQPDPFRLTGLEPTGIAPLSPARQWLYENRRLDMKPYLDFTPEGAQFYGSTDLVSMYPGVAKKIIDSRQAGYSDAQIMANIEDKVTQSLDAGYTDGMIERNLYYGYKGEYGFWDRPSGAFSYGRPKNILEKMWDYLGTTPNYHTDPIKHELRAVVERGVAGFTGGMTDMIQEEIAIPQSIPGTIAGSAANLIGFIQGPLKLSKKIIGGRLAPTATGLRGVAQVCIEGSATLGLAQGISTVVPAFVENESLTDAGLEVIESAGTGALTGFLYPLSGAIPSKPLRLAVGLAALDVIRNKGDFTIDDVVQGVKDGTIDREELASRSFGYLMDLFFLSKVPSMRKQLAGLEHNAMVRKMLQVRAEEAEAIIVQLGKAGLIAPDDPKFLDGVGRWDKRRAFGSDKEFNKAYQMIQAEQAHLAIVIQKAIATQAKVRIPKELEPLAQRALLFTNAKNFASETQLKIKDAEKAQMDKAFKGDLKHFWAKAQEREAQRKHALTLHESQIKTILDASATERMYNLADTELQALNDGKIKKAYQKAGRAIWDTSANVKAKLLKETGTLGKEAVIRHDLVRGAGPKVARMISDAANKIYSGLTKAEEITLNRIIQSRRTIAIEKYRPGMKHPAGLGLKEHQAYLDSIPKKTFMKLNERASNYFAEMDAQLLQLRKAGVISQESYKALLNTGDYSPRHFLQHIDAERTYTFGGKRIAVWDSGIKALDEGSYQVMENNSRALLAQVVTRTQARIFRNQANKALYDLAKEMPDNKVIHLAKVAKVTKAGKPVYQKPPAGFERLGVMVDGQLKEMLMPNELAREWVQSDPAISRQMANVLGWVTGAKILRPMATGINPEFAIANLPRDIAHAFITTYEYSPHVPIAAGQMARDYAATIKDTLLRRGAWHDYLNEGGGMGFLTHQGRITKKATGSLSKFQDVLGYLGETSEIWTRLALRQRAIRNGKPGYEATHIARNYLDFAQGGWFIKGADSGVPYLNAGIQGTRGIFRAAKEKPALFAYKMAEIGTLATGLYLANRYSNPECWESISDHDKANYFIVTTPLSYNDEEGNKRHLYFRVAKDQGQRLTCTLFENLMAKYLGDEISVDQVTTAAQQFISIGPTDLPPSIDAFLGYASNEDFWRREDVWKGPKVEAKEEYRAYTHPAFVEWGELTGMSPERTRHALEQVFTGGNIYTSLVGGGLRQIMDPLPEDVKEETTADMLRQAPFLRRVLKATDPYTKYAEEVESAKVEEGTRRYKQTRTLDALSEQFYAEQIEQEQVKSFIAEQPWQDRQRLIARHQRYGKLYEIPDKRWWLNLMDMPPETAATAYWTRYEQADKAERKRLDEYMRKVPGIATARFMIRLNQLKQKDNF